MKQLSFKVEEYHRGEWIPLEGKDVNGKKLGQKVVKISQDTADVMNIDSNKTKLRYVLETSKSSNEETPLQKAKRLQDLIYQADTIEEVDAISKGATPSVIKAAELKKAELSK